MPPRPQFPHVPIAEQPLWPAPLLPLVEACGADAVWNTGIDILGFPPTWILDSNELRQVEEALGLRPRKDG